MSVSSSDWDDDDELIRDRNLQGMITALFIQFANQTQHTPRCTRRRFWHRSDSALRQEKQLNAKLACTHSIRNLHAEKHTGGKEHQDTTSNKTQNKRNTVLSLKEVIANALKLNYTNTNSICVNKNNNDSNNENNISCDINDNLHQQSEKNDNVNSESHTIHASNSNNISSVEKVNVVAQSIVNAIRASSDPPLIASSILRALKDPLNCQLRERLLDNSLNAQQLVNMDDESLLNPITRDKVALQRQRRLEQKTVQYIEQLDSVVTHLFTCPSCSNTQCYANFRSTDFVKWQGDDPTPTLLTCTKCRLSFRA